MSVVSRVLFAAAFVLLGLAVLDRVTIAFGYTILRGSVFWWRLAEFAAVLIIFVVALQLREIRQLLARRP